jgi:hypothetical protein
LDRREAKFPIAVDDAVSDKPSECRSADAISCTLAGSGFGKIRNMKRRTLLEAAPLAVLVPGGMLEAMESAFARESAGSLASGEQDKGGAMAGSTAVYELRVYHANPGKLESLVARFRDHTMRIFAKHGIKSVAYWTALDEPVKSSTLIYMLEHPSRDAATANWKSFQEDPEWKGVKEKSEANGKLVEKIDSTFLTLTDFSPRLG